MTSRVFYIVKPTATCPITRQASINARVSVPNLNSQASSPFARDKNFHIKFENYIKKALRLICLPQSQLKKLAKMSVKMMWVTVLKI